ncbi:MAG: nickel insertion protein [Thermoplasmatota archaeon]
MNVTLDLRCGVSGDMVLGALLEWYGRSGDAKRIIDDLESAASVMSPTRVKLSGVDRHGSHASRISVSWDKMERDSVMGEDMINIMEEGLSRISIDRAGREMTMRILKNILDAESIAHIVNDLGEVHLHETGTPDTIVDAVGIGILYDRLELDGAWIQGTPISLGYGTVETSHGVLEVPVPAVRSMIRNLPVRSGPVPGELATPTGVAAAKALVEIWLDSREGGDNIRIPGEIVGSGAGMRAYPNPFRNVLDLYLEDR